MDVLSPLNVCVPASTSNLGPGFDLLGIALALTLDVTVATRAGDGHSWLAREDEAARWPERDNLLWRAFDRRCADLGFEPPALAWSVRSEIPIGRGLGSSGAAIAAGLVLADALARDALEPDTPALLKLGLELEGHPDNSTASLLGGCTLALPADGELHVLEHPLHASIGIALAWPDRPVTTDEARAVLPREVPFAQAVDNPRRLAFLLRGLSEGDGELLRLGETDHLHVDYRLPLIRGGRAALAAARATGAWLATVSGSGSALIALGPKSRTEAIADAMGAALEKAGGSATARAVDVATGRARVAGTPCP